MTNAPQVRIFEQPATHQVSSSKDYKPNLSIHGVHSLGKRRTFPVVEIRGWKGPLKVVVSCVTKDPPYYPHPFRLINNKRCKNGVYVEFLPEGGRNKYVILSNVAIQNIELTDIANSIEERKYFNVDPFKTGFEHTLTNEDLYYLRLCAHVYLQDAQEGVCNIALAPVVSNCMFVREEAVRKDQFYSIDDSSSEDEELFIELTKLKHSIEDRFPSLRLTD